MSFISLNGVVHKMHSTPGHRSLHAGCFAACWREEPRSIGPRGSIEGGDSLRPGSAGQKSQLVCMHCAETWRCLCIPHQLGDMLVSQSERQQGLG